MAAIPLNLLLEKGTDWDATFNIQNEDNTTGLTNTASAALEARRYVYDIILTSPQSIKTRVIEGIVEVTPGVT